MRGAGGTGPERGPGAWLRRPGGSRRGEESLFLFHYAGGNTSLFVEWDGLLPEHVQPVPVQLPGRGDRFREAPFRLMEPLVDRLLEVLSPELDRPFSLFGYSMGARVAYCLSSALAREGLPSPERLMVAASPAPALELPVPGWNGTDGELVGYLDELGRTPPEVLGSPELLSLVLPTVRADLAVVGDWAYPGPAALRVPLYAFCGEDDPYAPAELMRPWERETESDFALTVLPGGHFFAHSHRGELVGAVSALLAARRRGTDHGGRTVTAP